MFQNVKMPAHASKCQFSPNEQNATQEGDPVGRLYTVCLRQHTYIQNDRYRFRCLSTMNSTVFMYHVQDCNSNECTESAFPASSTTPIGAHSWRCHLYRFCTALVGSVVDNMLDFASDGLFVPEHADPTLFWGLQFVGLYLKKWTQLHC